MEREIRAVDTTSWRAAAIVLGRAFRDDPIVMAILRDISSEGRTRRLTTAFGATLTAYLKRSRPLCVIENERVGGVALIHPPGTHPLPLPVELGILIKTVAKHGLYGLGRWSTWLRTIDQYHPRTPYCYLEHLGVEPTLQGQGIGSLMLQALTQEADREGWGCFLETANPRNLPLYRRFGFEVVGECDIIGVPTWFLQRPALRNAADSLT